MKKIFIIAVAVVLIPTAVRFCAVKFDEASGRKQAMMGAVKTVQLAEVDEIDVYNSIEIPGRVQSQDKVELVARVDGYLQKKYFNEGDFVKKGQVLLTIEQTQYLNALNKAKADLENAKASLYKATKDYDRGAELVKKDYISKSTYDSLYAEKKAAQAAVKSASAMLAEANRNYGYTSIKSPVDGKIGSLQIQEGNYVTPSSGVLATVTKTNPIYVKYSIDSKLFDELRNTDFIPQKGSEPIRVDVILPSGKVYPIKGVQDFWDNQISTSTGTIDFRATFDNDENILIPGDFVKVKVYSNQKNTALVVPQDVAMQDTKGRYVYVLGDNDTVAIKYFTSQKQYENYWIVDDGLQKGDKYIVTALTKLMPGDKIKCINSDTENNQQ